MGRVFAGLLGTSLLLASVAHAGAADEPDPARVEFFEAKVRPVLAAHCIDCHGPSEAEGRAPARLARRDDQGGATPGRRSSPGDPRRAG